MKLARVTMLIGIFLLLAGCAEFSVTQVGRVKQKENWYARGSYSIQNYHQVKSGNYEWQQDGPQFNLRIYGPLYAGNVLIVGNAHQTRLIEGRKVTVAASPEALIQERLQLELPVSGLRYWLRAEAVPGSPVQIQRNTLGKVEAISQSGWQIQYLRYKNFNGREMPNLIAATGGQLQVRISVNTWE